MYIQETISGETWYWTSLNFSKSNRTLKYNYGDRISVMVASEILLRIGLFIKCVLVYCIFSNISALVLRMIMKSSTIFLFHCFKMEDILQERTRQRMRLRRYTY